MESPDTMSGMPTAPVPVPQTVRLSRHWLAAILIAAVLSFVGKVTIASRTFGATDALLWEANLKQLREAGPLSLYENGTVLRSDDGTPYHSEVFNHPPFVVRLLALGGWLSRETQMPLRFCAERGDKPRDAPNAGLWTISEDMRPDQARMFDRERERSDKKHPNRAGHERRPLSARQGKRQGGCE